MAFGDGSARAGEYRRSVAVELHESQVQAHLCPSRAPVPGCPGVYRCRTGRYRRTGEVRSTGVGFADVGVGCTMQVRDKGQISRYCDMLEGGVPSAFHSNVVNGAVVDRVKAFQKGIVR